MFAKNWFYYLMLFLGAAAAIAVWLFNVRKDIFIRAESKERRAKANKDFKGLIIFFCALPAALILSFVTAYVLADLSGPDIRGAKFSELLSILGKEYFFTLIYFTALSVALFWIFNGKPSQLNAAAPALAVFSAIARIGCLWAGCCAGKNGVPIPWMELGFGIAAFVLLQTANLGMRQSKRIRPPLCGIQKYSLIIYVAAYSLFRLITEFFRAKPAPFYMVQIYAAAALVVIGAYCIVKSTLFTLKIRALS